MKHQPGSTINLVCKMIKDHLSGTGWFETKEAFSVAVEHDYDLSQKQIRAAFSNMTRNTTNSLYRLVERQERTWEHGLRFRVRDQELPLHSRKKRGPYKKKVAKEPAAEKPRASLSPIEVGEAVIAYIEDLQKKAELAGDFDAILKENVILKERVAQLIEKQTGTGRVSIPLGGG